MQLFIAEVGLNHKGDEKYAYQYLNKLLKTDIDGISFQIREKSFYKKQSELTLTKQFYISAFNLVKEHNKLFGIALADIDNVNFFSQLKIDFIKIINRDLVKKKLVKKIYESSIKKIFVSTGKSRLKDLKKHISFLKNKEKKKLTFIHTKLTGDLQKPNLNSIRFMQDKLDYLIGYSHHSKNMETIFLCLPYKPSVIMFYVKGDKGKSHPDEVHAIKLSKVNDLLEKIEYTNSIIGDYIK
jgi:sialic acid synthase SpsE